MILVLLQIYWFSLTSNSSNVFIVVRTKAEKFERKEMLKFNFNLEGLSGLDSILQGVYVANRPKQSDYEVRKDLIRVFNEIAKEIYGNYVLLFSFSILSI